MLKVNARLRTVLLTGTVLFVSPAGFAQDTKPVPDLGSLQVAQNAQVAANTSANSDYSGFVESVITTGTRTKDRTVANSPVPIDVVTAKDFENSGKLNLRDALQQTIPSY